MTIKYSEDKKVKFTEGKHVYKHKELGVMTSVTTLIHKWFPKFDAKTISKYVAKSRRNKGEKITATQVRKEWKQKAKIATDKGTLIHYEMEQWLKHNDKSLLSVYHPASQQGVKWVENYLGGLTKPHHIPEMLIYNKEFMIAGQSDLVVFHGSPNLVVDVVDWKTNKEILMKSKYGKRGTHELTKGLSDCNYIHYTIQLSIYAYLLELEGYTINKLLLPHLTVDGVVLYELDYLRDVVKGLLEDKK